MSGPPSSSRTTAYKPALAWFAAFGSTWVFVLVMLGAFTTSIGAGMVFPDWPLSDGSLDPHGWLHNLAMFSEHSHRLSAGFMTIVTIGLAVAIWRTEARRWVRRLGWFAVGLVIVQAVVGGLRVLLNPYWVPELDASLGRLFAMLHACLAQIFVCTLFAITAALSRPWVEGRAGGTAPLSRGLRRLGVAACGLILLQLAIAAIMRHDFAGLAIPTFPLAPGGHLLPAHWDFRIGINFAHRVMALVLVGVLGWLAVKVKREPAAGMDLRGLALVMILLLMVQIALGATIIWTARNPYVTTAHVLVGALTFATTFLLTWLAHRQQLEGIEPAVTRARPGEAAVPSPRDHDTVGTAAHA